MPQEHPLRRFKGKSCSIRARAFYRGKPESLSEHILRFAIADRDTREPILTLSTGNGITQDEYGTYEVTVPADQMRNSTLPHNEYWYEVEVLIDGSESNRHAILYGPLYLQNSPFS
jgi:hypothetical protein